MNTFLIVMMVIAMTLSGTFGALYFKKAALRREAFHPVQMVAEPYLYIGVFCYLVGSVINILLLRFMDYSIVYPMTALTYVWTLIFSRILLKEPVNEMKLLAIFLILAGITTLNL